MFVGFFFCFFQVLRRAGSDTFTKQINGKNKVNSDLLWMDFFKNTNNKTWPLWLWKLSVWQTQLTPQGGGISLFYPDSQPVDYTGHTLIFTVLFTQKHSFQQNIPFAWSSSGVLTLCFLAHQYGLLGHLVQWNLLHLCFPTAEKQLKLSRNWYLLEADK